MTRLSKAERERIRQKAKLPLTIQLLNTCDTLEDRLAEVSSTWGDLPAEVQQLISAQGDGPEIWDNKTVSEQRDWAIEMLRWQTREVFRLAQETQANIDAKKRLQDRVDELKSARDAALEEEACVAELEDAIKARDAARNIENAVLRAAFEERDQLWRELDSTKEATRILATASEQSISDLRHQRDAALKDVKRLRHTVEEIRQKSWTVCGDERHADSLRMEIGKMCDLALASPPEGDGLRRWDREGVPDHE